MIKESNRSYSIDFIKGIAAISIVCLHCENNDAIDSIIHIVGRMAVPMFFIITGYYLPSMIKTGHMTKHIYKILKISLSALFFYLPLHCLDAFLSGNLWEQLSQVIQWNTILKQLLFSEYPFNVGASHLWYLIAILYILCLTNFFSKKHLISKLYLLIPVLFSIGYIISSVVDQNDPEMRCYYRNFLFIGLPYVLLGSLINTKNNRLTISNKRMVLLLIFFALLYCTEIGLYIFIGLPSHREHYLCIIPLVSIILFLAITNPKFGQHNYITTIGREYSVYIYVIHYYIVNKMCIIFHGSSIDSKLQMLSSIILSLLVSYIYIWIKKRWRNSRQKID